MNILRSILFFGLWIFVICAFIGFTVGFWQAGYSLLPASYFWMFLWVFFAAGYLFEMQKEALVATSGFSLIGLFSAVSLLADPYAIWAMRLVTLILFLISAALAIWTHQAQKKKPLSP